jgi:LDH2 family malate/lactate/ureidoglycolate dehydrogenase
MENKTASKNWGSVIIAIEPELLCSLDDFQTNSELMLQRVKNAKLVPTNTGEIKTVELFLPGERGDKVEEKNRKLGTVEMNLEIYTKLLSGNEIGTKRNIDEISKEV